MAGNLVGCEDHLMDCYGGRVVRGSQTHTEQSLDLPLSKRLPVHLGFPLTNTIERMCGYSFFS